MSPSTPQHLNTLTPVQEDALALGIELEALPKHVAIIMDGNGRWARKKGLGRLLGHREGYKTLRGVLLAASELGVKYLTVYAFSAENWRRPQDEVAHRSPESAGKEEGDHRGRGEGERNEDPEADRSVRGAGRRSREEEGCGVDAGLNGLGVEVLGC